MAEETYEERLDAAVLALLALIREKVMDEDEVSLGEYEAIYKKYTTALAMLEERKHELAQKDKESEYLKTRNQGMLNTAQRIRRKADMATNYVNKSGGDEEAAEGGRSAGAEGAVDRLIALYAGKVTEEQGNLPTLDDGTHRLCTELYGECGPKQMRKVVGGSDARMLHDAVDEIQRLKELLRAAKVPDWVIKGEDREE